MTVSKSSAMEYWDCKASTTPVPVRLLSSSEQIFKESNAPGPPWMQTVLYGAFPCNSTIFLFLNFKLFFAI